MRFNENTYCDDSGTALIRTYRSAAEQRKNYYFEHHHTECEICVCVRGGGVYAVGDKKYAFSAGDSFLFGSNEAHCITDTDGETELLNLHFEPRILWESKEDGELLALFLRRGENFGNKLTSDGEILRLVSIAEKELAEKKRGYKIAVRGSVSSILLHILRNYDLVRDNGEGRGGSVPSEKMSAAIDYVNENLEKKLSLGEIAAVACMTPTYFSAVFKKFNGLSPWEYITIKRVDRAIEMIKNTDMTKLEIAERCGFSSPSHFYKAFRDVTGKTPRDFENNAVSK